MLKSLMSKYLIHFNTVITCNHRFINNINPLCLMVFHHGNHQLNCFNWFGAAFSISAARMVSSCCWTRSCAIYLVYLCSSHGLFGGERRFPSWVIIATAGPLTSMAKREGSSTMACTLTACASIRRSTWRILQLTWVTQGLAPVGQSPKGFLKGWIQTIVMLYPSISCRAWGES